MGALKRTLGLQANWLARASKTVGIREDLMKMDMQMGEGRCDCLQSSVC